MLFQSSLTSLIIIDGHAYRCAIGRHGVSANKQEGDGTTPVGCFPLRQVLYRPDRILRDMLTTGLPCDALRADDGWCDDVSSDSYNQRVKLPFAAHHEKLWRSDALYDVMAVVGYNDAPVIPGKGSAIFLHVAREAYAPTAGCIALAKQDLISLLNQCHADTRLTIDQQGRIEVVTTLIHQPAIIRN